MTIYNNCSIALFSTTRFSARFFTSSFFLSSCDFINGILTTKKQTDRLHAEWYLHAVNGVYRHTSNGMSVAHQLLSAFKQEDYPAH